MSVLPNPRSIRRKAAERLLGRDRGATMVFAITAAAPDPKHILQNTERLRVDYFWRQVKRGAVYHSRAPIFGKVRFMSSENTALGEKDRRARA
jgi:hypothetical protein